MVGYFSHIIKFTLLFAELKPCCKVVFFCHSQTRPKFNKKVNISGHRKDPRPLFCQRQRLTKLKTWGTNGNLLYSSMLLLKLCRLCCFWSSLLCAHAATDSFTLRMVLFHFPVLMLHMYFRFLLNLLLSLEVRSY